ncbi:transposase [Candidatus Woesearchaeota archaeon]|nr:transposase [Candidatus Woesearchaeota archaeon]
MCSGKKPEPEPSKEKHVRNPHWVTFMFVTKCRYNCFLKQSHIDTCTSAFKEFEAHGFKFGEIGYGGNHVHFIADVPKRYSVTDAETMLKSRSAHRMFEQHPGFRKRYPRGSFWSGYEHHQSTGMQDIDESTECIRNQAVHHCIEVVDDTQMKLAAFS